MTILTYLHEQIPSVIHRDIKPSNISIAEPKYNHKIYLVDFGSVQVTAGKDSGTRTIEIDNSFSRADRTETQIKIRQKNKRSKVRRISTKLKKQLRTLIKSTSKFIEGTLDIIVGLSESNSTFVITFCNSCCLYPNSEEDTVPQTFAKEIGRAHV